MKKIILFTTIILMLAACSKNGNNTGKEAELAKLKKEYETIGKQIEKLEKQIAANSKDTDQKKKDISVTEVSTGKFEHYIEIQGKVDGEENVDVSAKLPAVVTQIFVREGDLVKKGQVLAQLDDDVYQQTLAEAKVQLDFVKDLFQRQKNLWDKKIGSEVQYLSAKNNVESLEKRIATLNEQIEMSKIKAPISGSIEQIPIKVGQMASPGFPAFRIVNFSRVKVVAELSEGYAAKVNAGDKALVNFPDTDYEAETRISFASKYINPVNRTFTVEVRLDPGKNEFKANMIAVLRINDYSSDHAITLPVNVVQESPKGQFVYLAKANSKKMVAKKQYIKTGLNYRGVIEITEGLKQGDKVISTGYQNLVDGQLVSVR